ncbi:hypothetical protein CLOSTHATH_03312, partial [Hungatella hathewayi DSM 13479]
RRLPRAIAVVIRKSNRDYQGLQFPGIIGMACVASKPLAVNMYQEET